MHLHVDYRINCQCGSWQLRNDRENDALILTLLSWLEKGANKPPIGQLMKLRFGHISLVNTQMNQQIEKYRNVKSQILVFHQLEVSTTFALDMTELIKKNVILLIVLKNNSLYLCMSCACLRLIHSTCKSIRNTYTFTYIHLHTKTVDRCEDQ